MRENNLVNMKNVEILNLTPSYIWKNIKLVLMEEIIDRDEYLNGISELELMGGRKSIANGIVNVDLIAEEGIKGQVKDLTKIMKKESCRRITVNNPYGVNGLTLLEVAKDLLQPGGEIMISGTLTNRDFKVLIKKKNVEMIQKLGYTFHFEIGKLDDSLKNQTFYQTGGKLIPIDKMMTFYGIKQPPATEVPPPTENNFLVKYGKKP
jgi:hypothetical protein